MIDGYGRFAHTMYGNEWMLNGRVHVTLSRSHPYANSAGSALRYRLLVMYFLGRVIPKNEHVHHIDGDSTNDSLDNLVVLGASYHGRYHCALDEVACWEDGVLYEIDGLEAISWPAYRLGAVISTRPISL